MSVTVASIVTPLDTYIGDSSTDRISSAERIAAITEATAWLQQETGNDHMIKTYTLPYFDNVHVYKVTTAIASLLEGADLRRGEDDQSYSFSHKSSRELAEEIGQSATESSWAIERRDSNWFLVVNHQSKYSPQSIASFDSLTIDGGTWTADTTNSDATNVTADEVEFKQGGGCINFDVDVSQSGNNRATIYNDDLDEKDLTDYVDLAAWVFWVYLPDVTNFSSITFYWGSSDSAYWSATVTTDINSNSWVAGWNRVKVSWADATMTSTPDETAIDYIRVDFNYTGSQVDDTDFRIDDLTIVRPENLTFHYTSWYVGTNSGGTSLLAFTATTDIPYFSGQYDQYKFLVAHKAAAILLRSMHLTQEADREEIEAIKQLNTIKKIIPSSVTKEVKSFKVQGINFRRSRRRARRY